MQKIITRLKPYQEYVALTILLFIWTFLLILSGTYKSGFHLMDDHSIINFSNSLAENSYWHTLNEILSRDFQLRFRPFYWINQLFLIQILQTNWTYWGIHHFLIALSISFFLFKIVRFFKLDVIISLFFVILVLIGSQTEIFYRFAPAERGALFYLTLGVYIWLIAKNHLTKCFGILFIILATLCKESFILVIPFLVVGLYFIDFTSISLANSISFLKKRKWLILFFVILVLAELIILYLLLSNKNSYLKHVVEAEQGKSMFYYLLGIDENLNSSGIVTQTLIVLTNIKNLSHLGILTFLVFIITLSHFFTTQSFKKIYKIGVFFAVLFLLLYFPQFALYLKDGFTVRYLIPVTLFYGIFIAYCYSLNKQKNIKYLQIIILCFFSAFFIVQTFNTCIWFKKEGEQLSALYNTVNKKQINSLLILADPAYDYESSSSIVTYLKQANKELKVKYIERNKAGHSSRVYLTDAWRNKNKGKIDKIENIGNYTYILVFDRASRIDKIIPLQNYTTNNFNGITLLSKK